MIQTTKEKTMTDTFYTPIITLGGQLTSMDKPKPRTLTDIFREFACWNGC
jgi:hypothetical protein